MSGVHALTVLSWCCHLIKILKCSFYACIFMPTQGVKWTVAWSPFMTIMSTRTSNFQNFKGFRCHYWCLSYSHVYSYGRSRLVGLVCSVCTLSDQLQKAICTLFSTFFRACCVQLTSPMQHTCGHVAMKIAYYIYIAQGNGSDVLFRSSRRCTSDLLNIVSIKSLLYIYGRQHTIKYIF